MVALDSSEVVMRNFSPRCLGPIWATMDCGVPSPKNILRLRYTTCFWRYSATSSVLQKYFIVSGTLKRICSQSWKYASIAWREEKTMAV